MSSAIADGSPGPAAARIVEVKPSPPHVTASIPSDHELVEWTATSPVSKMCVERVPMMTSRLMLCAIGCMLLLSCSGDKAKELLETAQFEERQMNLPHAKQLYEDVIRLYPTSTEAATAQERLAALKQTP